MKNLYKKLENKITLLNMLSSFFLQFVTLISGFIIPKIILSYFGSEVNGLVSSLNQFLNYISLVEGGITGVVVASLYKPVCEKDDNKVSSIIKTADKFYKKIGLIFIIYTLILAIAYPLIFKTNFTFIYVFSLTIVLSIMLLIQYMFSLTIKNLLTADKKIYIVSLTQSIIMIINMIISIISVKIFPNIHLLKLLSGIIFIIQPIVFKRYVKKNYIIDNNAKEDNSLIKSRWDGFAINIAYFIHSGTDIAILTIFTNLASVSIYSVYSLVSSGLKQIVNSLTSGIIPTIGQAYAKNDIKELNAKMDLYEYIVFLLVFLLFTIGSLLITPFVMIYTKGINDANYYQPLFGILLLASEAIFLLKLPHLNLAYSANKFKEITKPAFMEAAINIIVSIILVSKYGLIGVAIGTILAMIYRLIFHVYFTKKLIPGRNQWTFYKKLIMFSITTIIGLIICSFMPNFDYTILKWLLYAFIYITVFGLLYIVMSLIFFKKELKFFKKYLFRKNN